MHTRTLSRYPLPTTTDRLEPERAKEGSLGITSVDLITVKRDLSSPTIQGPTRPFRHSLVTQITIPSCRRPFILFENRLSIKISIQRGNESFGSYPRSHPFSYYCYRTRRS